MLTPTHVIWSQTAFLTVCVATGHAPDYDTTPGQR